MGNGTGRPASAQKGRSGREPERWASLSKKNRRRAVAQPDAGWVGGFLHFGRQLVASEAKKTPLVHKCPEGTTPCVGHSTRSPRSESDTWTQGHHAVWTIPQDSFFATKFSTPRKLSCTGVPLEPESAAMLRQRRARPAPLESHDEAHSHRSRSVFEHMPTH